MPTRRGDGIASHNITSLDISTSSLHSESNNNNSSNTNTNQIGITGVLKDTSSNSHTTTIHRLGNTTPTAAATTTSTTTSISTSFSHFSSASSFWTHFDNHIMKPNFGGFATTVSEHHRFGFGPPHEG